jgi:acyl carrier protein
MDLIVKLETKTGITIADEWFDKIKTINDLIQAFQSK